MDLRKKMKFSIQDRLRLATILSIASFVVIALILLAAFLQVRTDLGQVVETQLQKTVSNSHLALDLGQFLSRIKQLEATFYGHDEYLQQEGTALQKLLKKLQQDVYGSSLQQLYFPLQQKLVAYLEQCKKVNELLSRRRQEDQALVERFDLLEEVLAEQMIKAAQRGEPQDYYEQLTLLLAEYRGDLLDIIRHNLQENKQALFNADFFDPPANAANIAALMLKLKTIAASKEPINRFGRHLIDQLKYYQHLISRYQQEMIHLGRRTGELNRGTQQVLLQLTTLDRRHEVAATRAVKEVDRTILAAGAVVLALLVVLALVLGLIHLNLFTRHIKRPMEKIRDRLLRFRQGDYLSPMALNRDDEWGQIEAVFDDMLTDLVKSWSALQESERRYRNVFDNASEGIFQSTVEGEFLNVNPALSRMLCLDEETATNSFSNLREQLYVNPEDRDRMVSRLLQDEKVDNYEVQMRHRDGHTFWVSINCHLVRGEEGQVQFIEGTIDDISQRRQAEESLLLLKEYLHDIVDAMPSILIGVNGELNITLWNRQAQGVSGMTADQTLGQPLVEVFSLLEPALYLPSVSETLRTGEVHRLRKIAGAYRQQEHFYDLLIYPLTSPGSDGAVIHLEDVTEKVHLEEVMVQSEKMLSVGSLAAGMAHEINNPLAAVLQNVQVMAQRLSPALEKNRRTAEQLGISVEQVAEYARLRGFEQMMKSITSSGRRAARIIDNMLNFSRRSSSSFLPWSLSDLLEKTIELAASDYDMKHHFDFRTINIVREYQLTPDVPCESSQIQQVLLNLLKNAAQAIGSSAAPEIRVRVFPQGDQACLQVEDNGSGIDEATCKRIFEPFYTTKDVGVGTGLGLSVSYFLITENHKGSLTVSSEPGRGSCFSILLPFKRSAKES